MKYPKLRAFEQMKRKLHRPLITTEGIAAHKIRQVR